MSLRICDTSPQVPQLQTWDAAKLRQASQHSTKWLPKGNWIQDPVATSQHLPANPQASDGQIGICLFYPTNIKKENVGVWTHSHQLWLPGKPCAWRSFLRPSPPVTASKNSKQQLDAKSWCIAAQTIRGILSFWILLGLRSCSWSYNLFRILLAMHLQNANCQTATLPNQTAM